MEVGSSAGSADVTGGSAVSVSRPLATGSELRRLRFVGGKLRRSVRDLLLKFSRGPSRDPNSSWWQDEAKQGEMWWYGIVLALVSVRWSLFAGIS